MKKETRYNIKMVLCGDDAVGKTKFRRNYMAEKHFSGHNLWVEEPLICDYSPYNRDMQFAFKSLPLNSETTLNLTIFDISGNPREKKLRKNLFKGTHVALVLMFDLTSRKSFLEIDGWLKSCLKFSPSEMYLVALIGNKLDLDNHEVFDSEVEMYIQKIKEENKLKDTFVKYFKISTKTTENMEECFSEINGELIKSVNAKLSEWNNI